jgi:hypothetical protein
MQHPDIVTAEQSAAHTGGRAVELTRIAVAEHRVLLASVAAQLLGSWVLCAAAGRPFIVGLFDAFVTIDVAIAIFGVAALAVVLVRSRRADLPPLQAYVAAWRSLRDRALTPAWFASVALLAVVLPLSLAVFSAAKRAIPAIEPFTWDATLEHISRELHGGHHAWEILQPIVGKPIITLALDRFYHVGWSLLALGTLGVVVVSPVSPTRRRFLTAWVLLSFLGGTVAALAFSSAGPPYFGRIVHGADPYAALRAYLRQVSATEPLLSLSGRRALWAAYQSRLDAFGFGISAMPSMHIATTALVACLAFAVSPWTGIVATLATVLMTIGSVALCWHYAIDGYVGSLLAVGIWFAAGRLEQRDGSLAAEPAGRSRNEPLKPFGSFALVRPPQHDEQRGQVATGDQYRRVRS